jgi:hypothetical protein
VSEKWHRSPPRKGDSECEGNVPASSVFARACGTIYENLDFQGFFQWRVGRLMTNVSKNVSKNCCFALLGKFFR